MKTINNELMDDITSKLEMLSKEKIGIFLCDCALLNVDKIKPYTDKYNEIFDWLNNPSKEGAHSVAVYANSVDVDIYLDSNNPNAPAVDSAAAVVISAAIAVYSSTKWGAIEASRSAVSCTIELEVTEEQFDNLILMQS